ncbi:MAG: BsuPI-related putative proteinase inhibitor [Actinomycetota bacterium]|nr:BsuPI-related putative proteinase inhibitor [Actinomycetota bacterium]
MSAAKIVAIIAGGIAICIVLLVVFGLSFFGVKTTELHVIKGRTGNEEGRTIEVSKGIDDLIVSLSLQPNPVAVGENLAMAISVENTAKESRKLSFRSSQRYDFWVVDANGDEIWRWSEGRMFAQVLEDVVLESAQKTEFTESWNLIDSKGAPVKAGEYRVFGAIVSDELKGEELEIDVGVKAAAQ